MSNPAVKREAVLKVFPDLDRKGLTNEQIAAKVEDQTGVAVKPGYVKHIFNEARTGKNSKGRPSKLAHKRADLVLERVQVKATEPLQGAALLREIKNLADRAGGLAHLYDMVSVLHEITGK